MSNNDKRVQAALKKLGVTMPVSPEDKDQKVYEALVELWKERKSPPQVVEVAELVGIPRTSVSYSLRKLHDQGRIAKLSKGVWLPLVG